ncbi:DUF6562 domain-containing protein [Phocaeicola plebeius]|uniref:DUF6562 domain-containing protein n=1 Tax=Phocaeicola plebeius TaxID=310297 RepID=UPI003FD792B6
MKKILLYSTLALGVGLCSCSQEDLGESPAQAVGQPVTVSVQLPGEVGNDGLSRAVPSIPAGHKLRCILFVSDNVEGTADIRQEVVATTVDDNIAFTFTPPADTYTCSFWADFIEATATADNDGTYDDLYYNTKSLPNVTFAENAPLFFNNEACDAFTGHFDQTAITNGPVTLSRPLAKVNFVVKEEVSGKVSVTSGYIVNNGMNIFTGAVNTTTATLSCSDVEIEDANEKILFYNYLFADGANTKLPASISFKLGETDGTISTKELVLNANTLYNLEFSTQSGAMVTSPKVGDYFFTDGTWASSLEKNKNVAGVVFAVKGDGTDSAIENDVIDNYSDANGATDVLAWVVAAKDAGSDKKFYTGSATNLPSGLGTDGANDIKGYANTGLWYTQSNTEYEYEAVATAKAYDVTITGETLNSDWYLPAAGQLMALVNVYAENNINDQGNALAVKKSLQLIESEQTDGTALMGSGYYWTSSGSMSNESVAAYRVGFHETKNYGKNGANTSLTSGSYVRPVLTIFKSAN